MDEVELRVGYTSNVDVHVENEVRNFLDLNPSHCVGAQFLPKLQFAPTAAAERLRSTDPVRNVCRDGDKDVTPGLFERRHELFAELRQARPLRVTRRVEAFIVVF